MALHELGDVLGYGVAPSWTNDVVSGTTPPTFDGPHAQAVYSAPAPLDATLSNWAEGTTSGGNTVTMDPSIVPGVRRQFTSLDWAGLADIGWSVDQLVVTPSGAPPSSVTVGTPFGLSVTAEDPDGLVDTTFGASGQAVNLSLLANPGGATLAGTLTAQAVNGVATFSGLDLNRAAAGYTLQATSGTLTSTTAGPITVTPAPATQLLVTSPPPATVSAGGGFNLAVSALDDFGDLDTSYSGPVTLTLTANPGNSIPISTTVVAVAGVATFTNLILNNPSPPTTPHAYQLTATAPTANGSGQLASATTSLNVVAATATKLVVSTPAPPVTAGAGFGVTVMAEDSGGNLDTSFNGTVFLSILSSANPGGSTLGGTLVVQAVNGVATFTGLTLNKAGAGYQLVGHVGHPVPSG